MTMLPWLLFGAALWLNGILFLIVYGCFRYSAQLEQERDQAKALLDGAVVELELKSAKTPQPLPSAKVVTFSRRVH
jgi:hypothetical protein